MEFSTRAPFFLHNVAHPVFGALCSLLKYTQSSIMSRLSSPPLSSPPPKKRKHEDAFDELEVNLQAPEPPSKKALRKAKKGKDPSKNLPNPPLILNDDDRRSTPPGADSHHTNLESSISPRPASTSGPRNIKERSQYGVWIGNLSFTTTKEDLTSFFTTKASIVEEEIMRIHLPKPSRGSQQSPRAPSNKAQNRGFAYVDFTTSVAQKAALRLSETLLTGRKVLIKDAQSFEGRPQKSAKDEVMNGSGAGSKPPNKRIFVGNLDFDTTEDDLRRQFNRCGEIMDVFMATFEDSGFCKGFGLVTFREVEEAARAVRGWVDLRQEDEKDADQDERESTKGDTRKRPNKSRKWWVNRLKGRDLRVEFAEDSSTRYRKRFGKDRDKERDGANSDAGNTDGADVANTFSKKAPPRAIPEKLDDGNERVTETEPPPPLKKSFSRNTDRRTSKAPAVNAAPQRYTGAIRPSQGKKIKFD